MSADGGPPRELPDGFAPEHLVLAGLVRCTLASLLYHARRASVAVLAAEGDASGSVTRREADGRYAFVEIDCRLAVELDPLPEGEELGALLAKAERDCFVGASLTAQLRYSWHVNGGEVA